MTSRRVVVTGMGALTPIGNDLDSYWNGLLSGTSGCAKLLILMLQNLKQNLPVSLKDLILQTTLRKKNIEDMIVFLNMESLPLTKQLKILN